MLRLLSKRETDLSKVFNELLTELLNLPDGAQVIYTPALQY